MSVKKGVIAVTILSIVFVFVGVLLLFLGQETPSITLWLSMTFGGFILMVIGTHILLASILTYVKNRRKDKLET